TARGASLQVRSRRAVRGPRESRPESVFYTQAGGHVLRVPGLVAFENANAAEQKQSRAPSQDSAPLEEREIKGRRNLHRSSSVFVSIVDAKSLKPITRTRPRGLTSMQSGYGFGTSAR